MENFPLKFVPSSTVHQGELKNYKELQIQTPPPPAHATFRSRHMHIFLNLKIVWQRLHRDSRLP